MEKEIALQYLLTLLPGTQEHITIRFLNSSPTPSINRASKSFLALIHIFYTKSRNQHQNTTRDALVAERGEIIYAVFRDIGTHHRGTCPGDAAVYLRNRHKQHENQQHINDCCHLGYVLWDTIGIHVEGLLHSSTVFFLFFCFWLIKGQVNLSVHVQPRAPGRSG